MKREIDLTPYIPAIMGMAEKTSERDYLLLALIGEGSGFRRGEVVGNTDRREMWPIDMFERAKKKSDIPLRKSILEALYRNGSIEAPDGHYSLIRDGQYVLKMRKEDPLPGLQIEDLHDGSVWVKGKGGTQREQPLPSWLYQRLQTYIGKRKHGPIFDLAASTLYKLTRKYAQMAGVSDWRLVHPHRFRHFYIRSVYKKTKDPVMTQSLARHKDFNMTNHYIGEPDMSDKKAIVESLNH